MARYFDHSAIEKKWQDRWKESGIYDVTARDAGKDKKYVLVEFPYPSGNLHIGHWFAFAVVDIYVRMLRMQGKQVFFPFGFDSFGLPAENAAIKRGLNPKDWTYDNIATMTKQLESMGNAFTWNATLRTSDPEYYKWTQWMFTKLFENDIAYRGEALVNWCPSCNTVLANEQVVAGHCERCGTEVVQKRMQQWMMRITKYADRLVDDLDALQWPEHIKDSQRNWIGRKRGVEIDFTLSTGNAVKVFTTRPDTLYGATYLVLSPEHALISKLKDSISNWNEVAEYQESASKKDEMERTAENKEKTGIRLEGVTAQNPANGETIPVYIADYVLAHYGTGAIMAVPAHDERDHAFATKYSIEIRQVVETAEALPYAGSGKLMNSGTFDGKDSEEAKQLITEKVGGKMTNTYRLRDWSMSRQRYWGVPIPIVYDPEGNPHPVPQEHLPWTLPEDVDFKPTGEAPLAKSQELKERTEKIFGAGWKPEVETMDTFVDSSWYFLRYTDNHNDAGFASKEAQANWMPVDVYFGGAEHTTMHLLYSRFWQKAFFDLGLVTVDEPYSMRINRGLVLGPDGQKMSKSKGNVIDPDEQVTRLGADTVKMYLAFMGPYSQPSNYPWDMGGIAGIRRFLERVWAQNGTFAASPDSGIESVLHQTIQKVTADINEYKFNTAISALMIFLNDIEKKRITKAQYEVFVRLLAPFAPHLTEELWETLGYTSSIHLEAWPEADPMLLKGDGMVCIGVQVDGKIRGVINVQQEADETEVVEEAKKIETVLKHLEGREIEKVIYVKGKILNILAKKA